MTNYRCGKDNYKYRNKFNIYSYRYHFFSFTVSIDFNNIVTKNTK